MSQRHVRMAYIVMAIRIDGTMYPVTNGAGVARVMSGLVEAHRLACELINNGQKAITKEVIVTVEWD